MRSLRLRITLALALGQLAVLVLATLFARRIGGSALTDQFDASLRDRAAAYESLIEQEGTRVEIDPRAALALAPTLGAPREFVQIWGPGGRRLYRSPELEGRDLPKHKGTVGAVSITPGDFAGSAVRLLGMRAAVTKVESSLWARAPGEAAVITLVIARERYALDRAKSGLLAGLLVGDLFILLTGALIAWVLVRRGLVPLGAFGRQVGALDVATLGGSFDPAQHPHELEPVVEGLNDLRARLDEALRREKRLNASLAHEFRTPLSELRAMTSVALQDLQDTEFTGRALERVHEVAGRLTELMGLIRQMVRVEHSDEEVEQEELDLGVIIGEVVASLRTEADGRGLTLTCAGLEGESVRSNRTALLSICSNLVGNAVHHAPRGSQVRCSVQRDPGGIVLCIRNACADLSPGELVLLTEPFWRGPAARSDPDRHGLGLAIARGMAGVIGLELRLDLSDGSFVAELSFPGQVSGSPS